MNHVRARALSKVPAIILGFCALNILATTLGETGGDSLTPTLGWGYAAGAAFSQTLGTALGDPAGGRPRFRLPTRRTGIRGRLGRGPRALPLDQHADMRVLLVGNTTRSTMTLRSGLQAEGFVAVCVGPGAEAVDQATKHSFDVVIIDVALRSGYGVGMVRQLREHGVWTPVIVLTAGEGEHDETDALNHGADDYAKKPVSLCVLVARLRALARRGAPARPVVLSVGTLTLDPVRHTVHRGSTLIDLTPREHGLLEYLMRHEDVVVTKADILQNVWDSQYRGAQNVVEVYVGYLRRKIDVPFGTNTIETIRGVGYRLIC